MYVKLVTDGGLLKQQNDNAISTGPLFFFFLGLLFVALGVAYNRGYRRARGRALQEGGQGEYSPREWLSGMHLGTIGQQES